MPKEIEGQDPNLNPEEDIEIEGQPAEPEGGEGEKEVAPKEGEPREPEEKLSPEQIAALKKKAGDYDALLPEFTKKSQRLAEFEKGPKEAPTPPKEAPFYHKEGWVPKDYGELQKAIVAAERAGETRALEALKKMESDREMAKGQVDEFVKIVKGNDPEFDEDDFFEFADKHKFPVKGIDSLSSIYSAYLEVRDAGTEGAKRAKKAILERKKGVVGKPGSGKGSPYKMDYKEIRGQPTAFDAVKKALEKQK